MQSEVGKNQREYLLREQMKAIQKELGEGDDQAKELDELREKIEAAGMPDEVKKEALRELDRLSKMPAAWFWSAHAFALAASRLAMAMSSLVLESCQARTSWSAILAVPMTPQRSLVGIGWVVRWLDGWVVGIYVGVIHE